MNFAYVSIFWHCFVAFLFWFSETNQCYQLFSDVILKSFGSYEIDWIVLDRKYVMTMNQQIQWKLIPYVSIFWHCFVAFLFWFSETNQCYQLFSDVILKSFGSYEIDWIVLDRKYVMTMNQQIQWKLIPYVSIFWHWFF